MSLRVFRNDDISVVEYGEAIKFWSNAEGELHCHGMFDVLPETLPAPLHRAYLDLFWEGRSSSGSLRYLVETKSGYGIALINEYDRVTAENAGVLLRPLFETVIQDAEEVSKDPLFEKAEVFAGEFMGFDGCHELVAVFPADIPVEEFCAAAARLDELTYQACGLGKGAVVDSLVQTANDKAARFVSESEVHAPGLGAQAHIRDRVLDVCYSIPGYEKLSLIEKNQLYVLVKKSVDLSMEWERDVPF